MLQFTRLQRVRHDLELKNNKTTCEFDTASDEVAGRDGMSGQ